MRFTTSSSPLYLPKAFECTIIQRVLGTENQPMFKRGSGSQAPRNFHSPCSSPKLGEGDRRAAVVEECAIHTSTHA